MKWFCNFYKNRGIEKRASLDGYLVRLNSKYGN